ncbi:protein patched homolog 3-like isoform X3 [Dreissena polymorpha]|uniref:protein patched homolog 3-like isoform X3 n=1 Tax=Dreissena polymorpha TaxID=45954 RepID=UPI0022640C3D|nr:protein patched homolog 3-like isoform X3 [Dreissena polymorpha]
MQREHLSLVDVSEDRQEGDTRITKTYQVTQVYYQEYEASCLQKCSNGIIRVLEGTFYRIGLHVARHPYLVILVCLLVCGLCGLGLLKFEQTSDDAKLWVPVNSRVLPEKAWMENHFPEQFRYTSVIITASNILTPAVLNSMYDMYLKSSMMYVEGNTNLEGLCVKVGQSCNVQSILELWNNNGTIIRKLTMNDVLHTVNSGVKYSPVYGTEWSFSQQLGGIRRDRYGNIIGASAASMLWVLHKDPQKELSALDWEKQMISMATTSRPYIDKSYIYATRTFDDEGYGAVNADTTLLTLGFIIVFIFIILVLGRLNLVENKLYVSLAGIFSIGLAIVFSYGLAMAFGFLFGPIHNLMPFLLLGIGVDDMFVIVSAWNNLSDTERVLPLDRKMALTLKHAGVSITVTSITDIVAFGIGGSTVIPALSAFCAYAALGILALYLLVATFFVAVLTLDERRISDTRNSVLFCYKHKQYVPNACSQKDLIGTFLKDVYSPTLMKKYCKVAVAITTVVLASVNTWSFTKLRQDFDLYDYLPRDSYATEFVQTQMKYFPDRGFGASIYCGDLDYFADQAAILKMYADLNSNAYIQNGSLVFWYPVFLNYLKTTREPLVTQSLHDGFPGSRDQFNSLLLHFLQQREGRSFYHFLKFGNQTIPQVTASYMQFVHAHQSSSAGDIDAMESVRNIVDNARLVNGTCFSYGFKYLNNETNKVLKGELYRNLSLACVCVFLVTLLLIANLWTCILVFTCVLFTVVDVVGTLQFWDVTIDTASSILITLCVGLAVDYSAHVGHMFMTLLGTREERARATLASIGPAVLYGGLSTFLAFVLLANSRSYGFILFFRVFMTVVIFGLFHGLVYLPVILTWVGPAPYPSRVPQRSGTEQAEPVQRENGFGGQKDCVNTS